ncbi:MAG TPA: FtsX-like permease family protein, partial [Rectinemataceae bacterium]|nr:FtsX-like permease family protein [Rectinemataceae bacterium]
DTAYGLFGSEVPIASDYESIPAIADYVAVQKTLEKAANVAAWTPIVSVAARVEVGGYSQNCPVFGAEGPGYFKTLSSLRIRQGDPNELSKGGVFLNSAMAAKVEAALKRPLALTDVVTFSMYSGGSFKIRTGHFAGIYAYPARNEALDRVVLVDPTISRSLANYTLGFSQSDSQGAAGAEASMTPGGGEKTQDLGADSLDSLFATASDVTAQSSSGTTLKSVSAALADTSKRDALVLTDQAAWSFVLVRTLPGASGEVSRTLEGGRKATMPTTRIMDWREAAGSSAQALLALQAVFYVALGFIALGAILVIMNSLVISVLERTGEIGTMRGLGASRGFIRGLFITESMSLTLGAGIVGIIGGILVSLGLGAYGIQVSNPFLASLFGGTKLVPLVTVQGILLHGIIAALIGVSAWIYPVSVALRIQPVSAMSR